MSPAAVLKATAKVPPFKSTMKKNRREKLRLRFITSMLDLCVRLVLLVDFIVVSKIIRKSHLDPVWRWNKKQIASNAVEFNLTSGECGSKLANKIFWMDLFSFSAVNQGEFQKVDEEIIKLKLDWCRWNQRGVIVRLSNKKILKASFKFHRKSIKTFLSLVIVHAFLIRLHDFLVNLEIKVFCSWFGRIKASGYCGFFFLIARRRFMALNFSMFPEFQFSKHLKLTEYS